MEKNNFKEAIKSIKESESFIMAWEGGVYMQGNEPSLLSLLAFIAFRLREDGEIKPEHIKKAVDVSFMSTEELAETAIKMMEEKLDKLKEEKKDGKKDE